MFRQEAGRDLGPHPALYVLLFVLCLAAGNWTDVTYGTVAVWPANGVLIAAMLQLHRRKLLPVLAACFAINVVCNVLRHDPMHMVLVNAALNMGEALMASVLARRFCGAAMDMRRPRRLARFALLAVLPAVCLSAIVGITAMNMAPDLVAESYQNYISVETLGILITTPALLLLARSHRFRDLDRPWWEKAGLLALLAATTAAVFAQSSAPVMFLVFLPLLLIAFRLSPPWAALAVIVTAMIVGGFSLEGYGPATLSRLGPDTWPIPKLLPILRMAPVLHLFLAAVVVLVLPASTVLTERRRLEAQLRARTEAAMKAKAEAEHAALAKSRFLSMMSHEMRTPLNGVAGFAEMLTARSDLDADARRQIEQIRLSSDGLMMLVDDVLDYARGGEDLTLAPFSLAQVVCDAAARARVQAEAKGLTLDVAGDLDPQARHLGDARRVRQVLQHLLSNAVKFTARGWVEVRLTLTPAGADIAVLDTGPGLCDAALPTLFQPFAQGDASTRREHEGTGMGLALTKRLVGLMSGEVRGGNRPEIGAVFTVRLPLERLPDSVADGDDFLAAAAAPHVLVVDDHPVNREVAALMLTASGCEVTTAADGAEAVDAVRAGRFDLVLMDVRMPRMDGLEATRAIRALAGPAADTPVVAMTADAMPEDVARCRAAGMGGHLAKPVSRAALGAVLAQVMGDAGGARFEPRARAS